MSRRQMQRTGRANLTRLTCYRRTLAQVIEAVTVSEPSHPKCQVLRSWRVRTFDTAFPPALSSRRNHHPDDPRPRSQSSAAVRGEADVRRDVATAERLRSHEVERA